jgi:hypothetical protein
VCLTPPQRFVGIDWIRKGGDLLVAAFGKLLKENSILRMTIEGYTPLNAAELAARIVVLDLRIP